jgi:hypothetical protein
MNGKKMSQPNVTKITRERLYNWGTKLIENNGTPALLLGVGHGERSGDLNVFVCEDLPEAYLKALVTFLYQRVVIGGPIEVK